jgi:hypothetical protein
MRPVLAFLMNGPMPLGLIGGKRGHCDPESLAWRGGPAREGWRASGLRH